jgi:predicted ArsR family transcriptional regulator
VTSIDENNFPTRERILRHLLRHSATSEEKNNCSVKNIALAIGLSSNVTWNHLLTLEKDGFIRSIRKHGKTGRPAMVYSLTEKGYEHFPKSYMELTNNILDQIRELHGEKEIERIFANMGKKTAKGLKIHLNKFLEENRSSSLKAKLTAFIEILKDHGTFHELIEDETSFALKNYNCLTLGVVKINPIICNADIAVIHELIGQKPIKEKCMGDGDEFCLFRLNKSEE